MMIPFRGTSFTRTSRCFRFLRHWHFSSGHFLPCGIACRLGKRDRRPHDSGSFVQYIGEIPNAPWHNWSGTWRSFVILAGHVGHASVVRGCASIRRHRSSRVRFSSLLPPWKDRLEPFWDKCIAGFAIVSTPDVVF